MSLPLLRAFCTASRKAILPQLRKQQCNICINVSTNLLNSCVLKNVSSVRYKSKSKKVKQEASTDDYELEDDIDDFDKELVDKTTKLLQVKVNSLRADVILKAGLGMARSKIEELFYQSRIRVNGKKVFKKSEVVNEGDELDIIKGTDINNPKFLTVGRVEILSVTPKGEGFYVKLRRCKTLTIENYEDPWKSD
ncbi:uncharacterized protein C6orf203 [Agrilus planipennis]|uniref:Uncharacterized protein C6orf203 n=1 Tax=Agrilus planipennis TaxID=224129 RepID=A0A1W4WI97_AGRPL|nr:uncharacterized protein C6orf203 [Agrilus planipennis]